MGSFDDGPTGPDVGLDVKFRQRILWVTAMSEAGTLREAFEISGLRF